MPIPIPYINEKKDAFVSRCISTLIGEGTETDQAAVICFRKWDESGKDDIKIKPLEFVFLSEWARRTYMGIYNEKNLPVELYDFNYMNIAGSVGYGFGLPIDFPPNSERYASALKYRQNVSFFSGAKTFQQQSILSNAVFNEDGTKRSFKEFKEIADIHNIQYNVNYLRTEQDAAFSISQGAESWHETMQYKDIFPLLQYVTIGDARVRPEHRAWDGIILPVNDRFWDTHYPPNDWNCRCIVTQRRSGEITDLEKHREKYNKTVPKDKKIESLRNTSKLFANNPGKTGIIFGKSHPYFEFPQKYKKSALNNFGFKIPTDESVKLAMKKMI